MKVATYTKDGIVYRDATPEEAAEYKRIDEEMQAPEPTLENRVGALEATTDEMILFMAELIGG